MEGSVLGLPGAIDEKPADQPGARAGGRTEPGVPADGAKTAPTPAPAAVPVSARCWVGVISAQATSGTARAASSNNFFMAFPRVVDQRDCGQG